VQPFKTLTFDENKETKVESGKGNSRGENTEDSANLYHPEIIEPAQKLIE